MRYVLRISAIFILALLLNTPAAVRAVDPTGFVIASVSDDNITGVGWPLGAHVTLTIDDPGSVPTADYTDSATVGEAPWNPQQTYVGFQLQGVFDVMPGQVVTLTDNVTTKTLTITAPTITGIVSAEDTISGTATPGAGVAVNVNVAMPPMQGASRYDVADSSGNWSVDFSTPGGYPGEEQTFDIAFGQNLQAQVHEIDEDGDRTSIQITIEPAHGDVNCDGDTTAVDALNVLRYVAGLPNNLPPSCPPIGSY